MPLPIPPATSSLAPRIAATKSTNELASGKQVHAPDGDGDDGVKVTISDAARSIAEHENDAARIDAASTKAGEMVRKEYAKQQDLIKRVFNE